MLSQGDTLALLIKSAGLSPVSPAGFPSTTVSSVWLTVLYLVADFLRLLQQVKIHLGEHCLFQLGHKPGFLLIQRLHFKPERFELLLCSLHTLCCLDLQTVYFCNAFESLFLSRSPLQLPFSFPFNLLSARERISVTQNERKSAQTLDS